MNNEYIIKLVNLYNDCTLNEIPSYLLNNRMFMLNRILEKDEFNSNFNDLYHNINPFRNEKQFFIELIELCYTKLDNDYIIFDGNGYHLKFFYDLKKIFDFYIKTFEKEREIIENIIIKKPLILLTLDNDTFKFDYNDNIIKRIYKNDLTKKIINMYKVDTFDAGDVNSELLTSNKINNLFEIIKNVDNIFNYLNVINFKQKTISNLVSKKKHISNEVINIFENTNFYLQIIKNEKNFINKVNNDYYTKSFSEYCVLKYGSFKYDSHNSNISVYISKYIDNNNVFDSYIRKNINYLNLRSLSLDNIYIFLRQYNFEYGILEYLALFYNIYEKKYLIKKILNSKFYNLKNIFSYLYNDKCVEKLFNFFKDNIPKFNSLKPHIFNIVFSKSNINFDALRFRKIIELDSHNKKYLEKILYYHPKFIDSINFSKMKIFESEKLHFDNIEVGIIPSSIDKNSDHLFKFVNEYNFIDYLGQEFINNKNKMIDFCYKINCGILDNLPHFKKDKDIVSLSLKKNEKMIKYAHVDYINMYVNNNFDVDLTIKQINET